MENQLTLETGLILFALVALIFGSDLRAVWRDLLRLEKFPRSSDSKESKEQKDQKIQRLEKLRSALEKPDPKKWENYIRSHDMKPGLDRVMYVGEFDDLLNQETDDVGEVTTESYMTDENFIVEVRVPLKAKMESIPAKVTLDLEVAISNYLQSEK